MNPTEYILNYITSNADQLETARRVTGLPADLLIAAAAKKAGKAAIAGADDEETAAFRTAVEEQG